MRLAASEIIDDIDELSASPADFVSLDPSIEGPGLGVDRAASLAVRRARQAQAASAPEGAALELPVTTTPMPAKAVAALRAPSSPLRVFDQAADA